EVARYKLEHPCQPCNEIERHLGTPATAAFRRALDPDPARRFPSCCAFVRTLREPSFECLIDIPLDEESHIYYTLVEKLPSMQWEEGDSSWDKVRVWATGGRTRIRIFRYEGPGPFRLTITFQQPEPNVDQAYLALRDRLLEALDATLWQPSVEQVL